MSSIVFTNKAECQDCNRCVRKCPVKAIKVENSQASVSPEKCISCGTCVRECPQHAKHFRNDTFRAKELLAEEVNVAVSLAPSFAGIYAQDVWLRLPAALKKLGFNLVTETSMGAYFVAKETEKVFRTANNSLIASACPSIVSYVEKYMPEKIQHIVPVVSPMIAHAKYLKAKYGSKLETTAPKIEDIHNIVIPDWDINIPIDLSTQTTDAGQWKSRPLKVVFIGPCIAKKAEAERPEYSGLVDVVLTFQELDAWLKDEGINLEEMPEIPFDEKSPDIAKLFPLTGGLVKTAGLDPDIHSYNIINVSGIDEINAAFEMIDSTPDTDFMIDPLFCSQGCINGPAIPYFNMEIEDIESNNAENGQVRKQGFNIFERRRHLLLYKQNTEKLPEKDIFFPGAEPDQDQDTFISQELRTTFNHEIAVHLQKYPDEAIWKVLEKTGEGDPRKRLNCAACGYNSCYDKAVAVLDGMAEAEMCLPYIRNIAEGRRSMLFDTTPNGILVLDHHFNIVNINPAFRKLFVCPQSVVGKPISYIMDPEPFIKLVADNCKEPIEITLKHPNYNIVCQQTLYQVPEENLIVCLFNNITKKVDNKTQIKELRERTIAQAQELLNHQIDMAQNFAKLLGETAARGETLVDNLMKLSEDGNGGNNSNAQKGTNWIWEEYTK